MIAVSRWMLSAALLVAVAACGSEKGPVSVPAVMGLLKQVAGVGGKGAPVPEPSRADLAAVGSKIIAAKVNGLTSYMVPAGTNRGVVSWLSAEDRTIALRDGVMVATRGYGPDLMQAAAPTAAQLAAGRGTLQRSFYYLDGADQTRRYDYTCTLSAAGAETITVFGKQHATRHVTETCRNPDVEFTNEYWFEGGNFIRKSKQLLVPEWGYVTISQVIDNP